MAHSGAPPYVMLNEHQLGGEGGPSSLRPPPNRRNLPRYHSHSPPSKSSRCCCGGCLCWCCCFLLLFFVLLIAGGVYVYFDLNPLPPSYSVTNLSLSTFDVLPDLTLHTHLAVTVRAENPNTKIGIDYKHGSRVMIQYRGTTLCGGHLPTFYQGYKNVTVVTVGMDGRTPFGPGLQGALRENREKGEIPLDVYVRVPVQLRVRGMEAREVVITVHCELVVDNLLPGKKVGIKKAEYKANVEW